MEKTLKVDGMMCSNCEAHVKKALKAIDGVEAAVADHVSGTVKVTLTKEVADDIIKKAITNEGYKVI